MAEKTAQPHPQPLVMKFGGTSVGSAQAITQAVTIVTSCHAEYPQLVVVASAMSGITNQLLACARDAADGNWKGHTQGIPAIESAHPDTIAALVLSDERS